jgi:hypothetical protein
MQHAHNLTGGITTLPDSSSGPASSGATSASTTLVVVLLALLVFYATRRLLPLTDSPTGPPTPPQAQTTKPTKPTEATKATKATQPGTAMQAAMDRAANRGLGLVGPGGDGAVRALVADILTGVGDVPADLAMTKGDLARLFPFGAPGPSATLTLTDDLLDIELVVLERRDARAAQQDPDEARPLFVIAAPSPRLRTLIDEGLTDPIVGVVLGDWPHGVTCEVGPDGVVRDIVGEHAPDWRGASLSHSSPREAMNRIHP